MGETDDKSSPLGGGRGEKHLKAVQFLPSVPRYEFQQGCFQCLSFRQMREECVVITLRYSFKFLPLLRVFILTHNFAAMNQTLTFLDEKNVWKSFNWILYY